MAKGKKTISTNTQTILVRSYPRTEEGTTTQENFVEATAFQFAGKTYVEFEPSEWTQFYHPEAGSSPEISSDTLACLVHPIAPSSPRVTWFTIWQSQLQEEWDKQNAQNLVIEIS